MCHLIYEEKKDPVPLVIYTHTHTHTHTHRRTVHSKLLFKMGISETPNCLFCKTETESIEDIYIECDNVNSVEGNTQKTG